MKKVVLFFLCLFFHSAFGAFEQLKAYRSYCAGNLEHAQTALDTCIVHCPEDAQMLYNRGKVAYGRQQFDQAEAYFKKTAELGGPSLKIRAHYDVGNAQVKQEKYKEALDSFEKVLALDKNHEYAQKMVEQLKQKLKEQMQEEEKQKKEDEQKKQNNKCNKDQNKQHGDSDDDQQDDQNSQNSENQDKKDQNNERQQDKKQNDKKSQQDEDNQGDQEKESQSQDEQQQKSDQQSDNPERKQEQQQKQQQQRPAQQPQKPQQEKPESQEGQSAEKSENKDQKMNPAQAQQGMDQAAGQPKDKAMLFLQKLEEYDAKNSKDMLKAQVHHAMPNYHEHKNW